VPNPAGLANPTKIQIGYSFPPVLAIHHPFWNFRLSTYTLES